MASKTAEISRRVLGKDHNITEEVESLLGKMKMRIGRMTSNNSGEDNSVVILKRETNQLAVRKLKQALLPQTTFLVNEGDLLYLDGTPVVCVGLKNATHLNGEIGDVRGYNSETERYSVHFEDGSTAAVRGPNLRILIKLPERCA